ncbi:hypothetical protein [Secundilactobacillus mixtipabuli]|uniref:D-alanyl-D-alanine carboxypeptidase n=1 Tax=Secundilactobacillus mixtipabuli TaxID=1435342 RepID=A0A1Z5IA59_9LACO|nr:hypothetical protein [Secundilactobacillus mixtipabuli]GAW98683.1 hypothetical protein IWT30_00642 [Secundilactobacillus mixtipabuli]
MNLKKQLGLSLVVGGGLLFGLSTTQTTAHASTYLRYYENIPNKTVSVTNKNAYVYNNGRLSRKMGTMRYYGSKVEEYYAAHVVKNGKASIYYKFRVGHRTGWVWHGYLKSITSSTGTTPTTTPTSGETTPTNTTTVGGKSTAPGTTVDNMNWSAIEKRDVLDSTQEYIMQLFPGTIYNRSVELAAQQLWSAGSIDGVDFNESQQSLQRWLSTTHFISGDYGHIVSSSKTINSTGFVGIPFTVKAPYDHAAILRALDQAGYDANARSKFAGWSIGAEYEEPDNTDEGPQAGDALVYLVPNP